MSEDPVQKSSETLLKEMKALMEGLTRQVGEVRGDIGDVRKDLGAEIAKGNKEVHDLKLRMDLDEATFEERVTKVVRKFAEHGPDGPMSVFANTGHNSTVNSYASCVSSGGASTSAGPSAPGPAPRPSKEDIYWTCRRSLRIWPVPGRTRSLIHI